MAAQHLGRDCALVLDKQLRDTIAGTLTTIYRAVPGWDSITNAVDGTTGRDVENRADFEARRVASVALNARNTLASIRGAVLDVANVIDAYVDDNSTASPAVKGGVTFPAYALYVAALGGVGHLVGPGGLAVGLGGESHGRGVFAAGLQRLEHPRPGMADALRDGFLGQSLELLDRGALAQQLGEHRVAEVAAGRRDAGALEGLAYKPGFGCRVRSGIVFGGAVARVSTVCAGALSLSL